MDNNMVQCNRKPAFDLLRIISLIGVIAMHVSSGVITAGAEEDPLYILKLIYNAPFHYGVPIFVMISGALFLDPQKEINIKRMWTHNILRIAVSFCIWSMGYGVQNYLHYKAGWKYLLWEFLYSRDHLWFLPMIIGLYIITPILSTWIKNAKDKEIRYFILMFCIFQIACETLKALPLPSIVGSMVELRNIQLVCSYVGYFILGYYLIHIGVARKTLKLIYCSGIVGLVSGIVLLVVLSLKLNRGVFEIVDSFTVLTFAWSVFLFVMVVRIFDKNGCLRESDRIDKSAGQCNKTYKILKELGMDSFGTYLCHIAVIDVFLSFGYAADTLPVPFGVPLYVIAVYTVGTLVAALLRRIPVIGRYIC